MARNSLRIRTDLKFYSSLVTTMQCFCKFCFQYNRPVVFIALNAFMNSTMLIIFFFLVSECSMASVRSANAMLTMSTIVCHGTSAHCTHATSYKHSQMSPLRYDCVWKIWYFFLYTRCEFLLTLFGCRGFCLTKCSSLLL